MPTRLRNASPVSQDSARQPGSTPTLVLSILVLAVPVTRCAHPVRPHQRSLQRAHNTLGWSNLFVRMTRNLLQQPSFSCIAIAPER